jgi:hypothetical protein
MLILPIYQWPVIKVNYHRVIAKNEAIYLGYSINHDDFPWRKAL